jgi:hypothetical protein
METKSETPALIDYGIHNEASNIRAHVCVLARTVYIFPTHSAVAIMGKYPVAFARQPGVLYPTAKGHKVPVTAIPNVRKIILSDSRLQEFTESLPTTEKGRRAQDVIIAILKAGKFPLWFEPEIVEDADIQRQGEDLIVKGKWKIEVKCDFRGGIGPGCTGNLYLQIAELNPLKHF